MGQPALLDGKAAVELLGYAPAPGLGGVSADSFLLPQAPSVFSEKKLVVM